MKKTLAQMAAYIGVRTPDIVQDELKALFDGQGLSWRKIALREPYKGIPHGTLNTIYHTGEVGEKWRKQLGVNSDIPRWLIEATYNLKVLEENADHGLRKRIYSRDGKRVR